MLAVRQFTVDHKDYATEAEKLVGTLCHDPQPGEEKLVCSHCRMVGMHEGKIVFEAFYEDYKPLIAIVPPPPPVNPVKHNG